MILHSLRLKGFRGIRAGLRLEEINIDFDKLPARGLIALVGDNGWGKTTIMDNCHPYRMMPYKMRKCNDLTPDAFTLGAGGFYGQCYGSDACKDLVVSLGEKRYRSLVLIDADRKKQECYLYYLDEGGQWQPVKPSDGKTKTYDEAVESVFGSPTLFFTSVFRAQGAKNLSDYKKGDIMSMVAELLNVDHIKEQSEKSAGVAKHLQSVVDTDKASLEAIGAALDEVAGIRADITTKQDEIEASTLSLVAADAKVKDALAAICDAEKQQASQNEQKARLADLEDSNHQDGMEIAGVLTTITDVQKRAAADVLAANSQHQTLVAELKRDIAGLDAELELKSQEFATASSGLENQIKRAEKIAGGAELIRAKVTEETGARADLEEQKKALAAVDADLAECRTDVAALNNRRTERSSIETQLVSLRSSRDAAIERAQNALSAAERAAVNLDGIPCGGSHSDCKFISDAVKARDSLGQLREALAAAESPSDDIAGLEAKLAEAQSRIDELAPAAERLSGLEDRANELKGAIANLEASLVKIVEFTRLVPELDQAEANLGQWQGDLAALQEKANSEAAGIRTKLTEIADRVKQREAELQTRLQEIASKADADVAGLETRKKELSDRVALRELDILSLKSSLGEDLETVLISLRKTHEDALQRVDQIKAAIRSTEIEVGVLEGRLVSLSEKEKEGERLRQRIARYNAEIVHWLVLAKACSNSGIIALEIRDAGPGISAKANDLLSACYGPRFAVRFETEAEKADGGVKDVFDIMVYDAETDETCSITQKSGGEVTWLEKAITRAICLSNVSRSDRTFDSLFSDEVDSALSLAKKLEYFKAMLRSLEIGTHSREFFISQTPDLHDMAAGKILLKPGEGVVLM